MRALTLIPFVALASVSSPAMAQDSEVDQLRALVAQLTSQIDVLSERIDDLESDQAETAAVIAATPAAPVPVSPSVTAGSATEISMGAAPEIESADGFSFKPFGRLMLDGGFTALPDGLGRADGFDAEARRVRLGAEGEIPGGFGYKLELEFAGGAVEVTDATLQYEAGDVDLTVGQFNNFQSLEELTSSRFTSFIERAAFTDAFGFSRRLGVGAQYGSGDLLLQAGLFSDNLDALPGSSRWSVDSRAVYMPKVGDTQLHFGASLHYAGMSDGESVRYRQRPLVHFTAERLINTGNIAADSEFGVGLEFVAIRGPLHVTAEGYRQEVGRVSGLDNVSFQGGYVEAGLFLTPGDSRGYRGGRFNRTRPANPVGDGGIGAVQLNVRYDYLDLNDGPITGGMQNGFLASVIWTTTDHTRFQINYGKLAYDDAVFALPSGDRDYSADVLGLRAEWDF